MEEKLGKPVIKELSVILTKESLVEQRHNDQKHKNNDSKSIKTTINSLLSEHFDSPSKKRTTFTELRHIYKRHNVTYKECKVILEKFNVNVLKQVQNGMHRNAFSTVANENILSKPFHAENVTPLISELQKKRDDVNLNSAKNLVFEKLPVYKRVRDVESKENDDLYAFDEPDFENYKDGKTKHNLNKKRKVKTLKQEKSNKKKRKIGKPKICNTYDAAVQEILEKVMKKVNNKLENKNSTPIRPEILHEHMDCTDGLLNVDDVGECNNDIEVNKNTLKQTEDNESFCEQNAQNNNSKIFDSLNHLKTNKKIHVISDITLDQSDDDTFWDEDLQPNANSTVLYNEKCIPWRYNEHLKRNPHYLNIKKTALPCLQQDMIIDHVQLKKLEEHFSKISRKPKDCVKKSSPIRESELFSDTTDKENVPQSSLFDSDNLAVNQPKLLQENMFIYKQKRNVLGPILQNASNIIRTLKAPLPKTKVVETPASVHEEVPKRSSGEKLDRNLDVPPQDSVKESVNNNYGIKLFEDEEPVINFDENSKIYIPKIRKKKRLYDNVEESNQDKHKKEMTKKEEAELDQWAAKFNSLCEDIEKYKLDIE